MEISAAVKATGNIAIIEDDTSMREALSFQLETAGHRVVSHPSAESFLEHGASKQFDCIVVDLCLPRMNGLQLLAQIKLSLPFVSIVLITGHGDMSTGVRAMREGAVDCLQKPIDDQTLLHAIARAAELSHSNRAAHIWRLELQKRESRFVGGASTDLVPNLQHPEHPVPLLKEQLERIRVGGGGG